MVQVPVSGHGLDYAHLHLGRPYALIILPIQKLTSSINILTDVKTSTSLGHRVPRYLIKHYFLASCNPVNLTHKINHHISLLLVTSCARSRKVRRQHLTPLVPKAAQVLTIFHLCKRMSLHNHRAKSHLKQHSYLLNCQLSDLNGRKLIGFDFTWCLYWWSRAWGQLSEIGLGTQA